MSPRTWVFLLIIALASSTNERNRFTPQMANTYDILSRFREEPVVEQQAPALAGETALPPEPAAAEPTVITTAGQAAGPQPVRIPTHEEQEAVQAAQAEDADPEMVKLESAYEAVKEDIMTNSKKIIDEKKWVEAVTKITASYEEKVKRVEEHIIVLRKEQKKLFTKKKQIENLKLQRRLEGKLRDANDELAALQESLKHVQIKNEELNKSHMDLRATIISIENQLAKLKGEDAKLKDGEGAPEGEEAGAEGGAEGGADGAEGAPESGAEAAAEDSAEGSGTDDSSP